MYIYIYIYDLFQFGLNFLPTHHSHSRSYQPFMTLCIVFFLLPVNNIYMYIYFNVLWSPTFISQLTSPVFEIIFPYSKTNIMIVYDSFSLKSLIKQPVASALLFRYDMHINVDKFHQKATYFPHICDQI